MGRVYQARHQRVSRRFAVKVLFGDHATDEKMRERFAREAEAASRLEHPNVISVVDFGETNERLLYLVMDFVEGEELYELIAREAPLSRERVIDLVTQLCRGLAYAHDQGLVHRDFKSENVIVTRRDGREVPRIVDFGIAILTEADDERLTTEGLVLGTPAYMAPEQAMGGEIDHRTDLFSLGVLMYELLAGVLPFEGSPLQIARANMAVDPPPFAERIPGLRVDPGLEAICMKLMAKRPEARYQSAAEVIDALDALAAPPVAIEREVSGDAATVRGPAVPEAPTTDEVVAASRRSRAWLWAALLLLLVAGAVTVVLLTRGGSGGRADAVALAPADAGLAAVAPPVVAIDAAPVAVDLPDAGASPAVAQRKRRPDAAVSRPPARRADAAAPGKPAAPITTRSLTELYVHVGEQIEALAGKRGEAAVSKLRADYRRIPFQDALRTPSLRSDVHDSLRRLERRVRSAR